MKQFLGAMLLAGVAASGARAGSSDDRWIHIRVDDNDDGPGRVDIQVPIGMVSGLLPMLNDHVGKGSLRVNHGDVDLAEIRAYWAAVRDAKDGEYITVRDREAHVRVAKSAGTLLINVDESGSGGRVRMKLPMPWVDAVLSGGDEVDLAALGRALEKAPSGDILTVDDGDSHVRIWIDAAPAAAAPAAP